MSNCVIILYSVINSPDDLQYISRAITDFPGVSAWSVDLEDCDKVLRVACFGDIGTELVRRLGLYGINSSVVAVFDENGRPL